MMMDKLNCHSKYVSRIDAQNLCVCVCVNDALQKAILIIDDFFLLKRDNEVTPM